MRSGAVTLLVLFAAAANAAPLEIFRDCAECPEMVELPYGSFQMGTQPNEIRRAVFFSSNPGLTYRKDDKHHSRWDETPKHSIEIDIPIAMGRHEITYDEWMACVDDGGCGGYLPPQRPLGADGPWIGGSHPVVMVSIEDARAYLAWLNQKLGVDTYRLPTEAEWEYAARAGTVTRFAQGDEVSSEQVSFSGKKTEFFLQRTLPHLIERPGPVPVDTLDAANPWALRHMSGNVRELTRSCYTERYEGWKTASQYLAASAAGCELWATRGGSYDDPMDTVRVAHRWSWPSGSRISDLGFRVLKELHRGH